MSFFVIFI